MRAFLVVTLLLALVGNGCAKASAAEAPAPPDYTGTQLAMGKYKLRSPRPPPKLGWPFEKVGDGADARYVASYGDATATLTLDVPLHDALQADLKMGRPHWGATVILDVETGAILAMAEYSVIEPGKPGAATRAVGKAASIFKVVTASALVRAGVPLSKVVCASGGKTRMRWKNLMDSDGGRCVRFEDIVPYSQNVAMAKLAGRYITPQLLRDEAERFGFGKKDLALDIEIEPSSTVIPLDDTFGFANAAAGFGETWLSAVHGAALAGMVGNGGVLAPPHIIESVEGNEDMPEQRAPERVLDEQHAAVLQAMMAAAVSRGTAYNAFHTGRWSPYGRQPQIDVAVAGKTGSLTDRDVDLDNTWFVGTAPAHDPKIAVAVVIVNDEWLWYVRALDVATRAVATYFKLHPEHARAGEPVARGASSSSSLARP